MLDHVKSVRTVKLGYLPTRRSGAFAAGPAKAESAKVEARLRELDVDYLGLDWLNEEGLISSPHEAEAVAERFRAEGVDAVFAAHCNFGEETAVGRVCKALGKPVLLWGPRDEAPDEHGRRSRDTQCGLFATSKLLRRLRLPFSYIVNSRVEDEVFARGLDVFLRAVNMARCVLGARIGQVGPRPTPFTSTMCNESELLERFGIEVVPVAVPHIGRSVRDCAESEAAETEARAMRERLDTSAADDAQLRMIAALKLTLVEWAERERLDALAVQCWGALSRELGVTPCFVHGELTDLGVPVACETDINGAVTSLAMQAAAMGQTATFFADLTIRHPEDDNAELLWHCGPFPLSLAAPDAKPALAGYDGRAGSPPGMGHFELRGGAVTLGRFDGDNGEYRFLVGHAEGCAGPHTVGTYLWVRVGNWPLWEERLIYGPYIHHVVGVHGKLAAAVCEGARYLGVEADCVEPTEEQIRAYLRGQGDL